MMGAQIESWDISGYEYDYIGYSCVAWIGKEKKKPYSYNMFKMKRKEKKRSMKV
jgi:hypothetical protein